MIMVRKATWHDLNGLSLLFNQYRVFYGQPWDIDAATRFLDFRLQKADSEIFVAENAQNSLVGFVQLYPLFSSVQLRPLWLLNDLFVEETSRGQRISKALILRAKELASATGACGILLETAKSNVIGNQLYVSTGFMPNENSNYYFWSQPDQ